VTSTNWNKLTPGYAFHNPVFFVYFKKDLSLLIIVSTRWLGILHFSDIIVPKNLQSDRYEETLQNSRWVYLLIFSQKTMEGRKEGRKMASV
jgi:hypothetical protein